MAESPEGIPDLAGRLVKEIAAAGIPIADLYIDPLLHSLSAETKSNLTAFEAGDQVMEVLPGVPAICGLTSISYGIPNRALINQAFLVPAVTHGQDSVILDPTGKHVYRTLESAPTFMGRDAYCLEPTAALRGGRFG